MVSSPHSEHRRLDRRTVPQTVSVVNQMTGQALGQLANIHSEGFMVIGHGTIAENGVYQLQLCFSEPVDGRDGFSVGAECLWRNLSADESQVWAGFQIIDIADEDTSLIDHLVASLNV